MSLTNAEAGAVNDLIERLTGVSAVSYAPRPLADDDRLIEAVTLLGDHAFRKLMAGFDGERAAAAVRAMLAKRYALAAKDGRDPAVLDFERSTAVAVADQRLDHETLFIDGSGEWHAEALDGERCGPDEVLLTHPSGRQVTVRVDVTVIDGLDVVQELAARPVRDLQLPTGGAA